MSKKIASESAPATQAQLDKQFLLNSEHTIDELADWIDDQLADLERQFRGFVTPNSLGREIRRSR